jgi:hypothetical protein
LSAGGRSGFMWPEFAGAMRKAGEAALLRGTDTAQGQHSVAAVPQRGSFSTAAKTAATFVFDDLELTVGMNNRGRKISVRRSVQADIVDGALTGPQVSQTTDALVPEAVSSKQEHVVAAAVASIDGTDTPSKHSHDLAVASALPVDPASGMEKPATLAAGQPEIAIVPVPPQGNPIAIITDPVLTADSNLSPVGIMLSALPIDTFAAAPSGVPEKLSDQPSNPETTAHADLFFDNHRLDTGSVTPEVPVVASGTDVEINGPTSGAIAAAEFLITYKAKESTSIPLLPKILATVEAPILITRFTDDSAQTQPGMGDVSLLQLIDAMASFGSGTGTPGHLTQYRNDAGGQSGMIAPSQGY